MSSNILPIYLGLRVVVPELSAHRTHFDSNCRLIYSDILFIMSLFLLSLLLGKGLV